MFPIVGMLAAAATAIGGYVLYWYESMSHDERAEADRLALEYSRQLYNKALDELSHVQFKRVQELVRDRLLN